MSDGVPKPALVGWAAREVAQFAASHLPMLEQLEEPARVDLLKGAPYRERDKAARRGTEVHNLAEQIIGGASVEVPEELVGHVDSYLKFLDDWDVVAEHVELVVGNRTRRYMGSLDLIASMRGKRWLTDIKTTRSGIFNETALQLAAYRFAEFYIDGDGNEQPMPQVDEVAAIWVRADGYDLIPVVADETTFRTFLYAQQVAHFTKGPSLVLDALSPKVDAA